MPGLEGEVEGVFGEGSRGGLGAPASTAWGSQWAPAVFLGSGSSVSWRGRPLVGEEAEPLVGVIERGGEVWVVADVPGVPRESVDVKVAERTVTIKVRSGWRYYRVVGLPAEVAPEPAGAPCRDGVLAS